ncbi:MAG: potassium channel family protein [Nanoarchaeota archaeon]
MKKNDFITLDDMFKRWNRFNKFHTVLDKLSFVNILILWIGIITILAVIYYIFRTDTSFLVYNIGREPVTSFVDTVYFSFITATSTGFGDITPLGFFKVVSIVEVIVGLLLLALVTSKLVSIKQDVILQEIYDISFNEQLSRLRSTLLLLRQNIDRFLDKLEGGLIRKREISGLYIHLSSFESILDEILSFFSKKGNPKDYAKSLDSINTELIMNSVLKSFEKIVELFSTLNASNITWRREVVMDIMEKCMRTNETLFDRLRFVKGIDGKIIDEWRLQKTKIMDSLNHELSKNVDANIFK